MNKSFHYYCIRVLAEMAGFSVGDAQTVSYASQYADDATEHKKIRIANIPDQRNYRDYDGVYFDPVCTAHSGKNWMSNLWKWAKFYLKPKVQRHVLMAFHYLPPNEIEQGCRSGNYKYVTEKNNPAFVRMAADPGRLFAGPQTRRRRVPAVSY